MRGGGEYRVGRYYKSGDDGERGVVVTAMAGERGGLVRRGWW